MQLACPACHTAFHVDPAVLGAAGRTVRCARCRNTWFARQADLAQPVMAEAAAGGPDRPSGPSAAHEAGAAALIQPGVPWNDMVMVEIDGAPPLAPEGPAAAVPPVRAAPAGAETAAAARPRVAKRSARDAQLGLLALVLGLAVVVGFTAREPIVRAVPNLAGFYAAIGAPVNLRGIEFRGLRTAHETQDGVAVLVIEGEIVNPTRQARAIPRLRLAVHGPGGRELYAWTALLPRESLAARESVTFRSRLASPPEDSERVTVRFLRRADLTDGD